MHSGLLARMSMEPDVYPPPGDDTDPIGDLDEESELLAAVLEELAPTVGRALSGAAFNAKHKRGPGGRFIAMLDQVKSALDAHKTSGGRSDPFADFDREQLRKVAKSRGIALKRGEDRDSIAAKLIADLDGRPTTAPALAPPRPARPRKSAAPKPKAPTAPAEPALPTHKPSKGRDLLPTTSARDPLAREIYHQSIPYHGKAADPQLAALGAMQGYDDVPTVATKDEMDRLLATGDYIEAWRGVIGKPGKTGAQMHEDFRSGPAYYGYGVYGNGYYFTAARDIAESYSDGEPGSLLRVLIPKSARIRPHTPLRDESAQYASAAGGSRGDTLYDEGLYAAAKGLDGIEIDHQIGGHVAKPGKPAFNWVNRSVLIVEEG